MPSFKLLSMNSSSVAIAVASDKLKQLLPCLLLHCFKVYNRV